MFAGTVELGGPWTSINSHGSAPLLGVSTSSSLSLICPAAVACRISEIRIPAAPVRKNCAFVIRFMVPTLVICSSLKFEIVRQGDVFALDHLVNKRLPFLFLDRCLSYFFRCFERRRNPGHHSASTGIFKSLL